MASPKVRATRSGSQPDALLSEIKSLKNAIETSKREVIKTLRNDIDCLKDTIKYLTARVEDLEKKNEKLSAKCQDLSAAPSAYMEHLIDECEDRRRRECNVFVTGLPEASTDCRDGSEAHDRGVVSKVLDTIGCSVVEADIEKLRRVGRIAPRASGKRPLLVTFSNATQKWKVLKNASRLRRDVNFSSVYINADLTPLQQLHRKKLLSELHQRRSEDEDVVLFRGQIIRRDEIKDLKSKNAHQFVKTFIS